MQLRYKTVKLLQVVVRNGIQKLVLFGGNDNSALFGMPSKTNFIKHRIRHNIPHVADFFLFKCVKQSTIQIKITSKQHDRTTKFL